MLQVLPRKTQWNPLIRKHLWGFKIMGYVIFEDQKFPWVHFTKGVIFAISFTLFNMSQHMNLARLFGDIQQMTINAANTLQFTTTIFRFYDYYTNRREFTEIILELDLNIRIMMDSEKTREKKVIGEHINYVNKLTVVFWICALITGILMCINTLIDWMRTDVVNYEKTPVPMIFTSWLPIATNWDNFPIYYVLHLYIMWVGTLFVPCWHAFMAAIMIYVILELRLIQNRFTNYRDYLQPRHTEEDIYNYLVECVKKQISVKGYVHKLLNLIKRSVFLDFVIYSGLICALLYQASVTSSAVMISISIFYILTMSMILWLYYWHANMISVNSENLGISLYMSDWHLMHPKCRRLILQILCFSNTPWRLKSGFVTMNISAYLAIIRASYSYFTILNQMAH